MANRTRPIRIPIDVTQDEKDIILANMERANIKNMGAYARKMMIDGFIINVDYTEIKNLTAAIGRIGNNVNQIARRANETGRINPTDIEEVKQKQDEITKGLRELILKLK